MRRRFWLGLVLGAVSFAQTQTSIPSIPTWAHYLDNHVTIDIPLGEEGRPFRIEGRIVDSRNVVVREFAEIDVNKSVFNKSFPPLGTGTYRLRVAITDKAGKVTVLDRFPPLTARD
jgi:hypothetical protein